MLLERVKSSCRWLKSFVTPQAVRKAVMVAGAESDGVFVEVPVSPYRNVTTYRPYKAAYLLVGTERNTKNPEAILYRFYDPITKKEFRISEELSKLLFFRDPDGYSNRFEGVEE